jgi:hypothetical protein
MSSLSTIAVEKENLSVEKLDAFFCVEKPWKLCTGAVELQKPMPQALSPTFHKKNP